MLGSLASFTIQPTFEDAEVLATAGYRLPTIRPLGGGTSFEAATYKVGQRGENLRLEAIGRTPESAIAQLVRLAAPRKAK